MAVADYVTREDLEKVLEAMETRIKEACAKHSREQADRVTEAIQRGTSSSFWEDHHCRADALVVGGQVGVLADIGRNMDKRSAMEMVNEHLGNRLLYGRNTSFANINAAAPLWWMNIGPSKFKSDLHLLLGKEGDGGLIWLRIKGNAFPDVSKVFRVRQDNSCKGCIDLEISSIPPKYMTDVKSGGTEYDFTKHIEHEWGRMERAATRST